jgi:DNA polymerase/3'-5' exonuclease PolX
MTVVELPLEKAEALGNKLLELLTERGVTKRSMIVGSVRRRKPTCGDLEILVDPTDVFADPLAFSDALDDLGLLPGAPAKNGARAPNGPRYYRKALPLGGDLTFQIDVFVALPPAEWGILELIRTGDKDFSQQMVTRLHRYGLRTEGGHLEVFDRRRYGWKAAPHVGDEATFFGLVTVPFIAPEDRDWAIEKTRKAVLGP